MIWLQLHGFREVTMSKSKEELKAEKEAKQKEEEQKIKDRLEKVKQSKF